MMGDDFRNALAVASLLSGNLAAARAALNLELEEYLRSQGTQLRPRDFGVTFLLSLTDEGVTMGDISTLLLMSPASTKQVLSRLSEAGWVKSEASNSDRRFRTWQITEEVRRRLDALLATRSERSLAAAVGSLTVDERDVLRSQVHQLLQALQKGSRLPKLLGRLNSLFERSCSSVSSHLDVAVIWFQLTRLYRSMRDEQMRFLATATDSVLDSAAYMTLYRANEQRCTLADVVGFLRVDVNTAVRVSDRLEVAGLVEKRRNPADRRQVVLTPTERGRRLLARVPPLDPKGSYFQEIGRLPEHGSLLATVLHKFTATYLHGPVVDAERLYSLLAEVAQVAAEDGHAVVGRQEFRRAMSHFVTGVAVVSVAGVDGPRGVTVNSLTSVSLDPPILLICFDRKSATLERVKEIGTFGVNILSSNQRELAKLFAKQGTSDAFEAIDDSQWVDTNGVPTLVESLVRISCEVRQTFEAGTHTVVFGSPRRVESGSEKAAPSALGFWRSDYLEVHEQKI